MTSSEIVTNETFILGIKRLSEMTGKNLHDICECFGVVKEDMFINPDEKKCCAVLCKDKKHLQCTATRCDGDFCKKHKKMFDEGKLPFGTTSAYKYDEELDRQNECYHVYKVPTCIFMNKLQHIRINDWDYLVNVLGGGWVYDMTSKKLVGQMDCIGGSMFKTIGFYSTCEGERERDGSFDEVYPIVKDDAQNAIHQFESNVNTTDTDESGFEEEVVQNTHELVEQMDDRVENEEHAMSNDTHSLAESEHPLRTPDNEKQKAQEEKQRVKEEKQKAQEEKQRVKEEKQKAREEKQRVKEEKQRVKEEKQRVKEEKQRVREEKQRVKEEKLKAREEKQKAQEEKQRVKEEKHLCTSVTTTQPLQQ